MLLFLGPRAKIKYRQNEQEPFKGVQMNSLEGKFFLIPPKTKIVVIERYDDNFDPTEIKLGEFMEEFVAAIKGRSEAQ